jgi:hypothetical protein
MATTQIQLDLIIRKQFKFARQFEFSIAFEQNDVSFPQKLFSHHIETIHKKKILLRVFVKKNIFLLSGTHSGKFFRVHLTAKFSQNIRNLNGSHKVNSISA